MDSCSIDLMGENSPFKATNPIAYYHSRYKDYDATRR
jgi:hypothetical protein